MEVVPIKVDDVGTAMVSLNDASMVEQPTPDSESIIAAHQNTWRVYRWQTNGTKALKRDDGTQIWRIHYRCSNWNKPETASGCKARFSEDFLTKDKRNSLKFRPIQHNHPPPTRTTLDQDIIDEIGNQARQGRKSSAIEKSILSATPAEDLTKSYRIPSRKQIQNEVQKVRNESGYIRMDTLKQVCMQSEKIISRYGKQASDHFLHHYTIFPEVRIVLASPKGLELLTQHGQLAVIDTSFELNELGLALCTILVHVGGVLVPASWFITDVLSSPNLEWFLRYIQGAVGGQWGLTWCYADFEPGLRNALSIVAPGVLTLGDSWHFFNDNHKWFGDAIDQSLHILWSAPTDHEFTTSHAGFINYWSTTWAPYANYFHKQWVENSQAAEWALFGRPQDLPSLDYQIEGYENRLMLTGLRAKASLDAVVNDLYMEWYHFQKLIQSPDMMTERLKDIEANQNKHTKTATMHEWINSRGTAMPLLTSLPPYANAGPADPSDPHAAAYHPADTLADPSAYAQHHAAQHHAAQHAHMAQLAQHPQHPQHAQHAQLAHGVPHTHPQLHPHPPHPPPPPPPHANLDPLAPSPYSMIYSGNPSPSQQPPTSHHESPSPSQSHTPNVEMTPADPVPVPSPKSPKHSPPQSSSVPASIPDHQPPSPSLSSNPSSSSAEPTHAPPSPSSLPSTTPVAPLPLSPQSSDSSNSATPL